ncbi:MAG: family 43 glycosylhydrolase [Spirochaetales bacterium]|nr:family 43 glycosylhydrolase [Spirochaetales bacterium]
MKTKNSMTLFLSIAMMLFLSVLCFADNPFVQTNYTADPAPMVHEGVVYVYTTHDEDQIVNNFYTMNEWKCYSTTDMQNWTDHGTMIHYKDFSWATGDAWAAQCVYRNGKFYLYVPLNNNTGSRIGVAVSDSPTGPFKDAIGKPLLIGSGYIDPSVFIDADGQAYLFWGHTNCYYVKLNQDMVSYSGGVQTINPKLSNYIEGPWFYKRNSTYYIVYASMQGGSESISYATSSSVGGPYTSRGTVMPTEGNSFTNHPGVIDYQGHSYLFYHNGALPGGGSYHRSVCVNEFTYGIDGSIPKQSMTKDGPEQLEYLNPYDLHEAETICWSQGLKTEVCSEGGMNLSNISNNDYLKVKGVDFGNGATSFDARVASAGSGGKIEIRINSQSGTLIGTCNVSGTGGWQNWQTVSCDISGATGVQDLYFKFTGGSGNLFNFNNWQFFGGEGTTPTPEPTPTPTPLPPQKEPIFTGGPYFLNGESDYKDLPDGLTNELYDFSIAFKLILYSVDAWTRIFDMGGDTNVFMMMTAESGTTGYPYFCITLEGNEGEQGLNGNSAFLVGTTQHIAITKSGNTATLYINGQVIDTNTSMTLSPANLGNTENNYIGRSQWPNDPYLKGDVEDFKVYNRAITVEEVGQLINGGTEVPNLGDANDDGTVNIVDALLIAQHYVGLATSGTFIEVNADVNCDNTINIVDALLVAQFYVGLISEFC